MAKTSVVERNKKRLRLVKEFGPKRLELKKIVSDIKLSLKDRMAAQAELTAKKFKSCSNKKSLFSIR